MSTVVNFGEPCLLSVRIIDDEIIAHLVDGRTISVPLAWSWRLSEALPEQRQKFEILGDGQGIHRFSKPANKAAQPGVAPDRAMHDG